MLLLKRRYVDIVFSEYLNPVAKIHKKIQSGDAKYFLLYLEMSNIVVLKLGKYFELWLTSEKSNFILKPVKPSLIILLWIT